VIMFFEVTFLTTPESDTKKHQKKKYTGYEKCIIIGVVTI